MPKRKRSGEPTLQERLEKHTAEVFRALKAAKGFERQRLSKRSRESAITPDKRARLDREISVLKSLDLHQTARAHLFSSLLKVKSIAASTLLPDEIRTGVPKPELSEEEKAALHNVTSGLYSREPVKQSIVRAIAAVCEALNVLVPEKGGKRSKEGKRGEQEEQAADRIEKTVAKSVEKDASDDNEDEYDEEEEWQGFESDVDEAGLAVGELNSEDEANEEEKFSKYDHLLGSSSDEDSEDEGDYDIERLKALRGKETVNLDDISVSGSESEAEEGEDKDEASLSASVSPPPAKKSKKEKKVKPLTGRPGDSAFLPTLMGGYISGSSSASDVDVAPAKKRLGQQQRQAIYEKKFGAKARHIQQQLKQQQRGGKSSKQGGGRDSGWDMRRGAVDADSRPRTPWKNGVDNPLLRRRDGEGGYAKPQQETKKREKDDQGALHPSWEARKKAKESMKGASFAGANIVFD